MLTAFDGVSGGKVKGVGGEGTDGKGTATEEENASLDAEKGAIRGGSRKNGRGGWERETVATQRAGEECASRKGAAFLSNVIETTIKYERTTMNASNNPELFASSISRPENEGALRRLYCSRGVKIWLNYTTGVQAVRHVRQVYVLVRSTILRPGRSVISRIN